MKRILFTLLVTTLAGMTVSAATATRQELSGMWDRGNTLYINADYQGALAVYDSIAAAGYTSAKLYYNMGNAYFKSGMNGKAIVYYNKALALSPSDADTRFNLEVANSYVKDDIAEMPVFFLTKWVRTLRQALGSNAWAVMSLVALTASLAGALLYLLPERRTLRKTGFFCGVVMFILFAMSVTFSITEKRELTDSSHAIVTSGAISVKSSPDKSSTDIFILHEGTKVKITGSFGEWSEITIPNGSKGWLPNSSIETI